MSQDFGGGEGGDLGLLGESGVEMMEVEEVEDKDGGLYGLGPEFKIRVFCGEVISLVKEGALTPSGAGGAGGGGGGAGGG